MQQERTLLEERLTAAQQNTAELKRHNGQLVERNSTAQRELTQERLARSQIELQLKNSQHVSSCHAGCLADCFSLQIMFSDHTTSDFKKTYHDNILHHGSHPGLCSTQIFFFGLTRF